MIFKKDKLKLLDQRILPLEIQYYEAKNYKKVCEAISKMVVRGAPAIGATGAFGYYLALKKFIFNDKKIFEEEMQKAEKKLLSTRPTAVNLSWAIKRMKQKLTDILDVNMETEQIIEEMFEEVKAIAKEDVQTNKTLAAYGNKLIKKGDTILTHCNAGALATVDYGTALGVIRKAYSSKKDIKVFIDETRPRLQGASLTAFEMIEEEIPATLIVDSTAATLMRDKVIDKIVVGADRIARNGDTANKIGTFMLSVIAEKYDIPFYIAAPISTVDFEIESGEDIEIEIREDEEITEIRSVKIAPDGIKVYNPVFDVTPCENISAIITEKGVIEPPFEENLKNAQ